VPGPLEVELKLELAPEDMGKVLASVRSPGASDRPKNLDSVYFDTAAHDLDNAGFTLRVRHIGNRKIQTIKASASGAAGLLVRPEWEYPIDSDRPTYDVPDCPLPDAVPAATLDAIAPIFHSIVSRRTFDVTEGESQIEVAADTGEITAGGTSVPVSELELELKSGAPQDLFTLARKLDAVAPVRLGVLTKPERGYRLSGSRAGRAEKAADLDLDPAMPAAAAFEAIAHNCIRQFRLNEALLMTEDRASAVHQARVALRRLRSAFTLFRPMLRDDLYQHLKDELRWLAGSLGDARDLDVLIPRITDKALSARLEKARQQAYAAARQALASPRARGLMLDLAEWLALGDWRIDPANPALPEQSIAERAAEILDKHFKRITRDGENLASLDDEARHEVRIDAKKLRYAAEFFTGLFQEERSVRRATAFLAALKELQQHLGDLNDMATAPATLGALGLNAKTIDQLIDHKDREKLLENAEQAWEQLVDVKRFWKQAAKTTK